MASSLRLVPDNAKAGARVENRSAPRLSASQVPSIAGLRLSPHGAEAALVNISASGILAECAVRLKPGSKVTVQFDGDFAPASVASRVVRCSVSTMGKDGLLRYHVGIAFNAPIALGEVLESELARAENPSAHAETHVPPPPFTPVPAVVRNRW